MNDLDRYLDRATRGLFGARRQRLRDELHGNLVQHALDLQLRGLSPHEALARALRDFGPPARISRGMLRLQAPGLLRAALLLLACAGTVGYAVATREPPTPGCARTAPAPCEAAQATPAGAPRP